MRAGQDPALWAGRIAAAVCAALLAAGPVFATEILAARTLRPGTVLTGADLRLPAGQEAGQGGMVDAAEMIGLEVRRAIYAGRPVHPGDLGPRTLVRRNAIVTMRFASGGLMIRTEGRALQSGGAGERIRVLNLASRQPVSAVIRGESLVEVTR